MSEKNKEKRRRIKKNAKKKKARMIQGREKRITKPTKPKNNPFF